MIAPTPLRPGIVIKYDASLWRVEHVNECRAHIIPLSKRSDTDSGGRGVSIGTNSYVEMVDDLERARTEIELMEAEKDLADARKALDGQKTLAQELAEAERELAALKAQSPVVTVVSRGSKQAWKIKGVVPFAAQGTLKALVLDFVRKHAGSDTRAVASAIKGHTGGAVAACLDRFWKSGVLTK